MRRCDTRLWTRETSSIHPSRFHHPCCSSSSDLISILISSHRLPRLVSAALLCASFTEVKEARNHVVDTCLYLLGSSDAAVAQSALLGLLDFLQSDTSRDAVDDNGWKQRVVSDLCPQASLLAKRGLEPSSAFQSCVSPVVSCLIKACSLQADASSLQDPKLLIIVSILIQATEIDHLKAMAIKSLSSFPSHPSLGPAFSDCLRQLPSDLKSRLQASIKAAAALPRADEPPTAMRPLPPPPISSISKGPMIQLKRFI